MFTPPLSSPPCSTETEQRNYGKRISCIFFLSRTLIVANTFPRIPCVVISDPILCPPHEYISASICVGGLPTFISYSSTVFWDARYSHVSAPICPLSALPLPSEFNRVKCFFGTAESTSTGKRRREVNDN